MNSYIDEDYYYDTYYGEIIPQENFEKFAIKASGKVRNRIFNRNIDFFKKEVQTATCSVADILYNQYLNQEKLNKITFGNEKIITSEKVGDYSRNISNVSTDELKNLISNDYVEKLIDQTIEDYLLVTGLLYCGGF